MIYPTIAAIATPLGKGGIGIVKISGRKSLSVARKLFYTSKKGRTNKISPSDLVSKRVFCSHYMYYGFILDPKKKQIIDDVLILYMKAPNSYTREDVVEIHTHGGVAAISSVIKLALDCGVLLAQPGEFTKRAFLNGRIDLTQAEAVIDIIDAKTSKALSIAAAQLTGTLKNRINQTRDKIISILSEVEAEIDFPDDDARNFDIPKHINTIEGLISNELADLLESYKNARFYREGIVMAIVGRPNVGKSSLLNRLVEKDRAIVTSVPGTTRDLIEVPLSIHGISVILADTAGIHDSKDPVEIIGIDKTKKYLTDTDIILFVIDSSSSLLQDDLMIYESIKDRKHIIVINKKDLRKKGIVAEFSQILNSSPFIEISALYNKGISELKNIIAKEITASLDKDVENLVVPNIRQKKEVEKALLALRKAVLELKNKFYLDAIAIDLKEAVDSLGNITGVTLKEDILDKVFSRFCIGK
mmetsp:Transcript_997/g.752  ORF Transcript_997/g.752 Transcript_997/m.752 type:complete len:473 (+) Transcript_997:101-1519(+)